MATVIFVHGISVRETSLSKTKTSLSKTIFPKVKLELQKRLPEIEVVPCSWGNYLGAKLNANGASIPFYDSTRNDFTVNEDTVRWMELSLDSFYELRLFSIIAKKQQRSRPGEKEPSDIIDEKVRQLNPSNNTSFENQLKESEIADVFGQAHQNVVSSNSYREALKQVSDDTLIEYRDIISRAIIAESISIYKIQKKSPPSIEENPTEREKIIKSISSEIMPSERGPGNWFIKQILKLPTYGLAGKRGLISDITTPMIGDILLYQGHGQTIRDLLENYIKDAQPPVVLLAHSLGGIASVDLLIKNKIPKVKLLVTVGSQVPYFYEINALQSLKFGTPLPDSNAFPEWLNIYDRYDFLSFIGGNVFPNRVQDIPVDNKLPFPHSHGGYWENDATWEAIANRIRKL
ncbi:MAG: hypothetical protein QNJ54_00900 [Prochloraceae cyanobacterium]|nr:hypothetical protein [Prochloraceae cyanobacterium]